MEAKGLKLVCLVILQVRAGVMSKGSSLSLISARLHASATLAKRLLKFRYPAPLPPRSYPVCWYSTVLQ